jgi:hypothetical protein
MQVVAVICKAQRKNSACSRYAAALKRKLGGLQYGSFLKAERKLFLGRPRVLGRVVVAGFVGVAAVA